METIRGKAAEDRGEGGQFASPGELERELSVAADLANLNLSDGDRRALALSVGRMLEFFSTMDDFPGGRTRPKEDHTRPKEDRTRPEEEAGQANRLRPDHGAPWSGPDLLDLIPERESRFVSLPNIL